MSNVKPGDRAIIIESATGRNISKIVLVIEEYDGRPMPPGDVPFDTDGKGLCWVVESLGAPFQVERGRVVLPYPVAVGPDAHLRRLDPPEEEQTNDEQGASAPVKDNFAVIEGRAS